ncbi:MAG TPA: DUF4433 domain-containing protein [Bacteroidetes bacterium]|nr:DUF4433 domain-containing protein [Bacteroidota bacterium]
MNSKADFLKSFQDSLSSQFYGAQNWWTKYLFHFTDISNALSILEHQALLSRKEAIKLGLMKNDNANDDVIAKTSQEHQHYARLYFAPSTPTQYNNEGFKPQDAIQYNAHCPMPIMFTFDFNRVFRIDNIRFTDGNLANNPTIYKNIADLKKLNFKLIYHRSWFPPEERNSIINARHSEILVKGKLPLESFLKLIAVRSEAEKETFLYQMPTHLRTVYQDKIYIQPRPMIFVNNWLYVNKVSIVDNIIHIEWHGCQDYSKCHDKYNLKISVKNTSTKLQKSLIKKSWYPQNNLMKIRLSKEFQNDFIELSIFIDSNLGYMNIIANNLKV